MIHYTCDYCKRQLDSENDLRYVVRMEVYTAIDELDDMSDADRDHLQEIQDILEGIEVDGDKQISEDLYQQLRFDLCCECRNHKVTFKSGQKLICNTSTPQKKSFEKVQEPLSKK